jgi:hypothetical protein
MNRANPARRRSRRPGRSPFSARAGALLRATLLCGALDRVCLPVGPTPRVRGPRSKRSPPSGRFEDLLTGPSPPQSLRPSRVSRVPARSIASALLCCLVGAPSERRGRPRRSLPGREFGGFVDRCTVKEDRAEVFAPPPSLLLVPRERGGTALLLGRCVARGALAGPADPATPAATAERLMGARCTEAVGGRTGRLVR